MLLRSPVGLIVADRSCDPSERSASLHARRYKHRMASRLEKLKLTSAGVASGTSDIASVGLGCYVPKVRLNRRFP